MNASQSPIIWTPTDEMVKQSNITAFIQCIEKDWGTKLINSQELYDFSITEMEKFWSSLWDYSGVIASNKGDIILLNGDKMPGAKWFPEAKLNFAENLLRRRDDDTALFFKGEDQRQKKITYHELYDQVSKMAATFKSMGVMPGDRIAGFMPNMPETIIAMLAAVSLGAVWSSCSPDFGVQGVLDRFRQVAPKIILSADGYFYNGKSHDSLEKLSEIVDSLPSVEQTIIVPYVTDLPDISGFKNAQLWTDILNTQIAADIEFKQLPFDHPLYIMFSSGTTGAPKCIIHGAGGTLLKQLSEQRLHSDIKPGDRVFFFTTCGWMMWNWLVTVLASEATVLLYDGSPFYPTPGVLFDFAEKQKMTLFGTSAKFIDAVGKAGYRPIDHHNLSALSQLCSTGSPLAPEGFDVVMNGIKKDIHLVSFSGGTDIMGCFCGGDPTRPVHRGEIQTRMLGMAVEVYDNEGKPLVGEKGELVCRRPFPSMPIGFLDDDDGKKYHAAYFEMFDNVWTHGDYVELTDNDGIIIFGRSDATLNPGGVRIGTAEIYRQVEKLDQVKEAIVIGQQWDHDVRVVLFVVLTDDLKLDDELTSIIKKQIRSQCTPRHVPAKVLQVKDIPRTKSGKITELAVRDLIHGKQVKNKEALANPEALDYFADRAELQS